MSTYRYDNGVAKVPYFCQSDGLWNTSSKTFTNRDEASYVIYGGVTPPHTIANSGCGPSCLSMAMSYILERTILPTTLFKEVGLNALMNAAGGYGYYNEGVTAANHYGIKVRTTANFSEVVTALGNGDIVMAIMGPANVGTLPSGKTAWTGVGHYILLIGITNGRIAVNDPGDPRNSYIQGNVWGKDTNYPTVTQNQISSAIKGVSPKYTIFSVPDKMRPGATPSPPGPEPVIENPPVIPQEKGIFGLQIDFAKWANGTGLRRIGEYLKLKAIEKDGRIIWNDITDSNDIKTFTPTELASIYGIIYKSVNPGYVGKFYVTQSPLKPEFGGTGVDSISKVIASINGVNNGSYNTSDLPTPRIGEGRIDLPNVLAGHIITAEARSESYGLVTAGDQGQLSSGLDEKGECAFIYDRDLDWVTNCYRLYSPDETQNALFRQYALQAANHACFLVQNANIGYNYCANQAGLINYIKANKGNIQFHNFTTLNDTNCINLCKLAYMAVFPAESFDKFSSFWSTGDILKSNTLEELGFRKFDIAYAQNANNLEIGDIIIKEGHAAIVVGVGGKNWWFNDVDYNPSNGEVKT